MKKIFIATFLCLVGCANPSVVQLSPDTYMLIKEDHAGIFAFNRNQVKIDTINEANAFAKTQGKIAIPISMKDHPVGILGDWASFEYQFKVIDKNDPEARRTSLVPRADVVIDKTEKVSIDVNTKDQSERSKDVYLELIKLDDLRKKGIISDVEFEAQKKKILSP